MAFLTRAAVAPPTPRSSLTTRETVFRLTPAALATSHMVDRGLTFAGPSRPDNVVVLKHEGNESVNLGRRMRSPLARTTLSMEKSGDVRFGDRKLGKARAARRAGQNPSAAWPLPPDDVTAQVRAVVAEPIVSETEAEPAEPAAETDAPAQRPRRARPDPLLDRVGLRLGEVPLGQGGVDPVDRGVLDGCFFNGTAATETTGEVGQSGWDPVHHVADLRIEPPEQGVLLSVGDLSTRH